MPLAEIPNVVKKNLVRNVPWVYAFDIRAKLFRVLCHVVQEEHAYGYEVEQIEIRRDYLLEDAIEKIAGGEVNPRMQWQIVFVDENSQVEDGVDGGGLFKEFITLLTTTIFNPNFPFFSETSHDRSHYPNPLSRANEDFRKLFFFFGTIVGKALYEGVLLKVRFAKFFLLRMISKANQFDDLKSLDPQMYENLLKVKYYDGDVEDLGLTMTTAMDLFGTS